MLHTHRASLFCATGRIRAYVPQYHLNKSDSKLSDVIRRGHSQQEIIERYGLESLTLPNVQDVDVWTDEWANDPKQIAPGWFMFAEPWDWETPSLSFEFFEIPTEYSELFGYDDIHAEGEPDLALYYEGHFGGLALELSDAEGLAPMAHLEALSFGSISAAPMRKIGRPKGTGFQSADEPLVKEMLMAIKSNPKVSVRQLAEKFAHNAAGHGIYESKVKRLERRLREYGY